MNGMGFLKRWLGGAPEEAPPQQWRKAARGARVLVVDDSPTIRAVLGRMLEAEGYAVAQAADGESALALARAQPPALIFLDIVLPGINGFAVLRALRHDPLAREVPIVMISGNPQATEQYYVQRFGADDFIRKPFGQAEVARSIDRLVRAGRLPGREAAEAGGTGAAPAAEAGVVALSARPAAAEAAEPARDGMAGLAA
ncbi:response regulator [Fulvimonas soli]|uniref:Twitching motility two-component system response regulator PilH n=1 Tax=Fulvimonas soli TaxID=155197 RepID=A0A316IHH1_9GAMM|nr:response regulator [Fulvimonas soli]PWK91884.1 twitching motility two-component system response regulator PilH [Fulvimonas soli]TNY26012.1 response regulator [Fulvimonas soli]